MHMLAFCQVNVLNEYDDDDDDLNLSHNTSVTEEQTDERQPCQ